MTSVNNNISNTNSMRNFYQSTLQQAQQGQRVMQGEKAAMCLEAALDLMEIRMSTGFKPQAQAPAPVKKKKKKKGFGSKLKKAFKKVGKGLGKIAKGIGKLAKTAISVVSGFAKMIPFVGPLAGGVLDTVGGMIPGGRPQLQGR